MADKKVLIVCGATATGKTQFGLDIAKELSGELISADSRQVYKTMDIVTGKDLPPMSKSQASRLKWRGRSLGYYLIQGIKVWLYDIVSPNEDFNVSFWRECADLTIADILSRGKLPIVVGGTGLYIKSLVHNLESIAISPDPVLRENLEKLSVVEQFNYLKSIDSQKANSLNESDRKNPRRLVRAIEIATHPFPLSLIKRGGREEVSYLTLGLTAPQDVLNDRIAKSIENRVAVGARSEYDKMRERYDPNLPSMTAAGYGDWDNWLLREQQYAKRQKVWFAKEPQITWFDVSIDGWQTEAVKLIKNWYN